MSDLVPSEEIERIVGAPRHSHSHLGRAVSAEQTVYILHSQECKDSGIDLRDCEFSIAMDRGIDMDRWEYHQDMPVMLGIHEGRLDPWDCTPRGKK